MQMFFRRGRPAKASEKPDLTLRLPFISDEFNRGAKQLLEKHNIAARLVNQRGTTLSDLTKKRRRAGSGECQRKLCPSPEICRKSHVVYLATCDLCGNRYVGMTVRQLHARALEHVRAATQQQEHTAFGDHYRTRHKKKKEPKLSFKILSQNHDNLRLHIEEALAIKTLAPELNKRQEENGNWLSPLNSLPSSNISFTPLTFAHTPFPPLTFHSLLSHLLPPLL